METPLRYISLIMNRASMTNMDGLLEARWNTLSLLLQDTPCSPCGDFYSGVFGEFTTDTNRTGTFVLAGHRCLIREEEKTWLKQVALLAVLWHLLEHKQETNTFLDTWAASEMEKLLAAREASREMAKAVHHGVKEQAFTVLAQVYETYLHWIDARPLVPASPLAALPPGDPDPLALPVDEEE